MQSLSAKKYRKARNFQINLVKWFWWNILHVTYCTACLMILLLFESEALGILDMGIKFAHVTFTLKTAGLCLFCTDLGTSPRNKWQVLYYSPNKGTIVPVWYLLGSPCWSSLMLISTTISHSGRSKYFVFSSLFIAKLNNVIFLPILLTSHVLWFQFPLPENGKKCTCLLLMGSNGLLKRYEYS